MRMLGWIPAAAIALAAMLAACDDAPKVETSKLEKSFSAAPPAARSAVEDLKAAVADGDYAKAGTALERLAGSVDLTPDQKKAIEDTATQMKDAIVQTAKGVAQDALKEGEKALDDVRKQLKR